MALYKYNTSGVFSEIKEKPFKLERDIQRMFETNMSEIMGLEMIKSEFTIKDRRIDTLAFDPQSKSFVIIEYKRERNSSVIDQGFTYLSLMLQNQADFILEYKMPKADQKVMERCKLILVSLIVFLGSAFTIMTFNTDVSVGDVFDNLYRLILGHKKDSAIMEAAYSIGIFVGILGFYNHFKGSKLKNDPTPIHIEMRNYEEEMNKAIIKNADRENETKK